MNKLNEISDQNSCINRASDDELVFVLLGRDKAAPYAIRCWASERIRIGKNSSDDQQIVDALYTARKIEESNAEEGEKIVGKIDMIPVTSSQILSIGHDAETSTLAITFKNTKGEASSTYHYANITSEQFEDFRWADSIGKWFGANIKKEAENHPFRKVSS